VFLTKTPKGETEPQVAKSPSRQRALDARGSGELPTASGGSTARQDMSDMERIKAMPGAMTTVCAFVSAEACQQALGSNDATWSWTGRSASTVPSASARSRPVLCL
jgi:hypothetical protein